MTKNRAPTPVYLDPGMHSGLEVKGLSIHNVVPRGIVMVRVQNNCTLQSENGSHMLKNMLKNMLKVPSPGIYTEPIKVNFRNIFERYRTHQKGSI